MIETIFNFAYSANFWTEKKACTKTVLKKHRNCDKKVESINYNLSMKIQKESL